MSKNLLPQLVSVSRNCGFTLQVNRILNEKLTEEEFEIFNRWLQICEEEKRIAVNQSKQSVQFGRRF